MGQKIHPTGFRLPVTRNWASRWYANNQNFATMLAEDLKVREYLKAKLKSAAVSRILIERPAKNARITIFSARPGVVIGKKGEDIENLKAELTRRLGVPVAVNIEEVRKPEVDAQLIADSITQQLEKRIMFRRAMKRAMQNAMRLGAQGIKIMSSGRLNGIEIARYRVVPRRPRAAAHAEGRHRLRLLRSQDHLRRHRREGAGSIAATVWPMAKRRASCTPPGAEEDRRGRVAARRGSGRAGRPWWPSGRWWRSTVARRARPQPRPMAATSRPRPRRPPMRRRRRPSSACARLPTPGGAKGE